MTRKYTHHQSPEERIVKSGRVASIADLEAAGFEVSYFHGRKVEGNKHVHSHKETSELVAQGAHIAAKGGVSAIRLVEPLHEMNIVGRPMAVSCNSLGIARCNDTDKFDRHFGTAMATRRALLALHTAYMEQAEQFMERARQLEELAGGPDTTPIEETPEFKRLNSYGRK